MSKTITLTMTEEQANVLERACDFYSRVICGQFQEIPYRLMMRDISEKDYQDRREAADDCLMECRKYIYPELDPRFGTHYGMGFSEESDRAYDFVQVMRYERTEKEKRDIFAPTPISQYDLPQCTVSEEPV